jgi:hypothetical protein
MLIEHDMTCRHKKKHLFEVYVLDKIMLWKENFYTQKYIEQLSQMQT